MIFGCGSNFGSITVITSKNSRWRNKMSQSWMFLQATKKVWKLWRGVRLEFLRQSLHPCIMNHTEAYPKLKSAQVTSQPFTTMRAPWAPKQHAILYTENAKFPGMLRTKNKTLPFSRRDLWPANLDLHYTSIAYHGVILSLCFGVPRLATL